MKTLKGDLVIHPGEWYFGADHRCVRTLLGSCIAITAWHPRMLLGGMCHYLLPRPPQLPEKPVVDPRYGIYALQLMRQAMERTAPLHEFHLGFYGGSDMFGGRIQRGVGEANIILAVQWLAQNRFSVKYQDTGGFVSRTIALDMDTGHISLKKTESDNPKERRS